MLGPGEGLVPVGLGGTDPLVGIGAGPGDRAVPLGLGGGDPRGGVGAGRLDASVTGDTGGVTSRLGLTDAGLRGDQLRGHLLRGCVSLHAPLVGLGRSLLGSGRAGLGDRGALLGGGADGFHLGSGRIGHRLHRVAEPVSDTGYPVRFGAQQAQQFRAGHLGCGHRGVGGGGASGGPVRGGGQATALPPGGDIGVAGIAGEPGPRRRA